DEEIKGDRILSYGLDTRSASQLGASSSFISTFDGLSGQVGTIDPSAKFTEIASTFSFSDIAVSKDGTIFGITPTQLFKTDPVSGLTSFVGGLPAGVNINALEFANDVLYGAGDSNLYAINTTNAGLYLIANLESTGFNSSGDLAFDAPNNRFLATSKGLTSDSLYAVSLTGEAAKIGDIGFSNILALMFEGEKLFGFTADGARIAINPGTGAGVFDTLVKGISDRIGGASGIQIKKGEVLSSTPGTILSADTIDVFLPPGGEITLEITVTVPGDGSEPIRSVRTIEENGDRSASATTNQLPLDVFLLQDLSGSFDNDLPILKRLVPNFLDELRKIQPDTKFGVGSFIDKPVRPFGDPNNAYVYQLEQPLTNDKEVVRSTVNNLTTSTGGDPSEGQLEALLQVARRTIQTNPIGFRDNARRVVVVSTDDTYHKAGDGMDAKPSPITKPNNGDSVVDPDEDYPSIAQAKQALSDANIFPVFTIAKNNVGSNNRPFYQDLVDNKLGFGKVVELESDSSNLIQAITDGLVQANTQIPLDKSSDDFGYVKDISPKKYENAKPGDKLKFSIRLQNDGKGSDDTLLLRIPGLFGGEEIKINVKISKVSNTVTAKFVDSITDQKLKRGIIGTTTRVGDKLDAVAGVTAALSALGVPIPTIDAQGKLLEASDKFPYGYLPEFPKDLRIKKNERNVSLKPISKSSTKANKTWIVTHGWNVSAEDNPTYAGDFSDLGKAVADANPDDRVLLLDWEEAATGGKLNLKALDTPSSIDALLRLGNYTAAKWIRPVAEWVVEKLEKEFGVDAEYASKNLNLIGHSLGSLLSNEIARIWQEKQTADKKGIDQNGKGIGVNTIFVLDPPSQLSISGLSLGEPGFGYDVDGRTPQADFISPDSGTQQIYLPNFKEVSNFSRAFVGRNSLSGNQIFAGQADESFQMSFSDEGRVDKGEEHQWVIEAFKNLIIQKNELADIGKLVNPNPILTDLKGKEKAYDDRHAGILAFNTPQFNPPQKEPKNDEELPKPLFLTVKNKDGGNDDIIYGTDDIVYGSDDIVYGTNGNDTLDGFDFITEVGRKIVYLGGSSLYSGRGNDIFYGEAGDDQIFGGNGDDTIYGGSGKDFINAEADNDLIEGGDNDDTIFGAKGNDTVIGGKNNDSLEGNEGDDTLIGGKDKDTLTGGSGNDIFVIGKNDGIRIRDGIISREEIRNGIDLITDFDAEGSVIIDKIKLIDLSFGDLDFKELEPPFNILNPFAKDTAILIKSTGEYLAFLDGVSKDSINKNEFFI
ncbi:MAG TPA: hypothetical protein DGO89_18500, partial [Microcoleaceae bacterium UBA9251]|nr:hypothetical protein [Microcoleaceae cyanobacterium UBA9251]